MVKSYSSFFASRVAFVCLTLFVEFSTSRALAAEEIDPELTRIHAAGAAITLFKKAILENDPSCYFAPGSFGAMLDDALKRPSNVEYYTANTELLNSSDAKKRQEWAKYLCESFVGLF